MDPRKRKHLDETPPRTQAAHEQSSGAGEPLTESTQGGSQELRYGKLLGDCLDRLATGDSQGVHEYVAQNREEAAHILPDLRLFEEIRKILSQDEDQGAEFRFTDFTDLRRIGGGAMGVVFRARQVSLDRLVALKVIHPVLLGDATTLERFKREARVTAGLDHPNIVKVHTLGLEGGFPYIAMELCDGENLNRHIERLRAQARDSPHPDRLDTAHCTRAAEIFAGAAEGLHHAHAKKVLHRDLKPSNMILDTKGRLRLVDFGLAWVQGQQALTPNERRLGTPLYMSPEQVEGGTANLGPGTDIFSLGVTLYEMLTLRQPFQGRNQRETEQLILHRDPVPPRKLNSRVHRDLETIVLKCIEKEPRRRYGTAEALAQDLRRFLRGDPIEARPLALHEKTARRLWRSRRRIFEGVLLSFLLVALFLLLHFTAKDFKNQEERDHERRNALHVERVKRALSHLARSDFLGRPKLTPNVQPLERPPLWQRKQEQPLVSEHFNPVHAFELEFMEMGAELPDIDPEPLEAAVAELVQDLQDFPQDAASHYHLARAYWHLENFDAALRSAEKALENRPEFPPALWLRASLLEKKGDPAAGEARAALDRAASGSAWARDWIDAQEAWLNRDWERAALAYEKLSAGGFDEPEPYLGSRVETFLRKGKAYLEARLFEEAHRVFAIAADRALCPEAALFLGKTQHFMGKAGLARKTFEAFYPTVRASWDLPDAVQWRKTVLRPPAPGDQVALDIASVYQEVEDYPSAFLWAEKADKKSAPRLRFLAGLHWRTGKHDQALKAAEEALLLDPESTSSLLVMGNVQFARGDLAAAETWYRRARAANDKDARCCLALGVCLDARKDFAAAEKWFRSAAVLEGHRAEAFYNLGCLLARRGRPEEARAAYEAAVAADPGHAQAMNNLGVLLDREDLPDEALRWYERASQVAPSLAIARYNAASVHRRRGRHAQALADYRQAMQLGLDEPAVVACVAICQYFVGQTRAAEESLRSALAAEFDNRTLRAMLYHELGVLYESRQGEGEDANIHLLLASEAYRKAVELFPTWVNARNQLGWALANLGNVEESELHLRKAIALAPRFGWAYDNLAWLKLKEPVPAGKDLETAIVFFEDATTYPRGDDSLLRLIDEYRLASRPDIPSLASVDALFSGAANKASVLAAWEGFRALPDHDPARARYFEGRVLEGEEKYAEALAAFEEATQAIPARPEPLVARARCLSRLGNAPAAEKLLREGIQSGFRSHDQVWHGWLRVVMVDLGWDLDAIQKALPAAGASEAERAADLDLRDTAKEDCRDALAWLLAQLDQRAVRINCGADDDCRAPDGTLWGRDRFHDGGRRYSFVNDAQAQLRELSDPLLEERYWSAATCAYRIPVPPGKYRAVLHFVEGYFTEPGKRVFDISLEGQIRRADYEPFQAGFRVPRTESFDLEVTDGVLDLEFGRRIENPNLAALEVLVR